MYHHSYKSSSKDDMVGSAKASSKSAKGSNNSHNQEHKRSHAPRNLPNQSYYLHRVVDNNDSESFKDSVRLHDHPPVELHLGAILGRNVSNFSKDLNPRRLDIGILRIADGVSRECFEVLDMTEKGLSLLVVPYTKNKMEFILKKGKQRKAAIPGAEQLLTSGDKIVFDAFVKPPLYTFVVMSAHEVRDYSLNNMMQFEHQHPSAIPGVDEDYYSVPDDHSNNEPHSSDISPLAINSPKYKRSLSKQFSLGKMLKRKRNKKDAIPEVVIEWKKQPENKRKKKSNKTIVSNSSYSSDSPYSSGEEGEDIISLPSASSSDFSGFDTSSADFDVRVPSNAQDYYSEEYQKHLRFAHKNNHSSNFSADGEDKDINVEEEETDLLHYQTQPPPPLTPTSSYDDEDDYGKDKNQDYGQLRRRPRDKTDKNTTTTSDESRYSFFTANSLDFAAATEPSSSSSPLRQSEESKPKPSRSTANPTPGPCAQLHTQQQRAKEKPSAHDSRAPPTLDNPNDNVQTFDLINRRRVQKHKDPPQKAVKSEDANTTSNLNEITATTNATTTDATKLADRFVHDLFAAKVGSKRDLMSTPKKDTKTAASTTQPNKINSDRFVNDLFSSKLTKRLNSSNDSGINTNIPQNKKNKDIPAISSNLSQNFRSTTQSTRSTHINLKKTDDIAFSNSASTVPPASPPKVESSESSLLLQQQKSPSRKDEEILDEADLITSSATAPSPPKPGNKIPSPPPLERHKISGAGAIDASNPSKNSPSQSHDGGTEEQISRPSSTISNGKPPSSSLERNISPSRNYDASKTIDSRFTEEEPSIPSSVTGFHYDDVSDLVSDFISKGTNDTISLIPESNHSLTKGSSKPSRKSGGDHASDVSSNKKSERRSIVEALNDLDSKTEVMNSSQKNRTSTTTVTMLGQTSTTNTNNTATSTSFDIKTRLFDDGYVFSEASSSKKGPPSSTSRDKDVIMNPVETKVQSTLSVFSHHSRVQTSAIATTTSTAAKIPIPPSPQSQPKSSASLQPPQPTISKIETETSIDISRSLASLMNQKKAVSPGPTAIFVEKPTKLQQIQQEEEEQQQQQQQQQYVIENDNDSNPSHPSVSLHESEEEEGSFSALPEDYADITAKLFSGPPEERRPVASPPSFPVVKPITTTTSSVASSESETSATRRPLVQRRRIIRAKPRRTPQTTPLQRDASAAAIPAQQQQGKRKKVKRSVDDLYTSPPPAQPEPLFIPHIPAPLTAKSSLLSTATTPTSAEGTNKKQVNFSTEALRKQELDNELVQQKSSAPPTVGTNINFIKPPPTSSQQHLRYDKSNTIMALAAAASISALSPKKKPVASPPTSPASLPIEEKQPQISPRINQDGTFRLTSLETIQAESTMTKPIPPTKSNRIESKPSIKKDAVTPPTKKKDSSDKPAIAKTETVNDMPKPLSPPKETITTTTAKISVSSIDEEVSNNRKNNLPTAETSKELNSSTNSATVTSSTTTQTPTIEDDEKAHKVKRKSIEIVEDDELIANNNQWKDKKEGEEHANYILKKSSSHSPKATTVSEVPVKHTLKEPNEDLPFLETQFYLNTGGFSHSIAMEKGSLKNIKDTIKRKEDPNSKNLLNEESDSDANAPLSSEAESMSYLSESVASVHRFLNMPSLLEDDDVDLNFDLENDHHQSSSSGRGGRQTNSFARRSTNTSTFDSDSSSSSSPEDYQMSHMDDMNNEYSRRKKPRRRTNSNQFEFLEDIYAVEDDASIVSSLCNPEHIEDDNDEPITLNPRLAELHLKSGDSDLSLDLSFPETTDNSKKKSRYQAVKIKMRGTDSNHMKLLDDDDETGPSNSLLMNHRNPDEVNNYPSGSEETKNSLMTFFDQMSEGFANLFTFGDNNDTSKDNKPSSPDKSINVAGKSRPVQKERGSNNNNTNNQTNTTRRAPKADCAFYDWTKGLLFSPEYMNPQEVSNKSKESSSRKTNPVPSTIKMKPKSSSSRESKAVSNKSKIVAAPTSVASNANNGISFNAPGTTAKRAPTGNCIFCEWSKDWKSIYQPKISPGLSS